MEELPLGEGEACQLPSLPASYPPAGGYELSGCQPQLTHANNPPCRNVSAPLLSQIHELCSHETTCSFLWEPELKMAKMRGSLGEASVHNSGVGAFDSQAL